MKSFFSFCIFCLALIFSSNIHGQYKDWIVPVPGDPSVNDPKVYGYDIAFQTTNYICGVDVQYMKNQILNLYDGQKWKRLTIDSLSQQIISLDESNDTFVVVLTQKLTGDLVLMYNGVSWKPLTSLDTMVGNSWLKGLGFINVKFYQNKLYGIFLNDDYNMSLMEYSFQTDSLKTITTFQQNKNYQSAYYPPYRMVMYTHDKKLYVAGGYDSTDHQACQGFGYYDGKSFVDKQLFQNRPDTNFNVVKQIDMNLFAIERPGVHGNNKNSTLHLMRNDTIIKDITGDMFRKFRKSNSLVQIAQNNFQIFRLNGKFVCYDLYSWSKYNDYGIGAISYDEQGNTWDTFDLAVANGSTYFFKDRSYFFTQGLTKPPMAYSEGCFMVSPSLYVSGITYLDIDSNCSKSGTDSIRRRKWVSLKNDSFYYSYLSDPDGGYEIPVTPGKYYFIADHPSISLNSCGLDTIEIDSIQYYSRNVPYSFIPPYNQTGDIEVGMSGSIMRRGVKYVLNIDLNNNGRPELSVQPRLKYNPKLQFVSSNKSIANQSNGYIEFTSCKSGFLNPARITVTFFVHQDSVKVDDVLAFQVSADSSNTEVDYSNNDSTYSETVRGPYDPNAIYCNPENKIYHSPQDIKYTIEFQNLGSDTAFNVRLVDTLPLSLDITSLNLIEHSGNALKAIANGNVVEFLFKDIKLCPKSVDAEGSKGYISFSVRLQDTMKFKEVISNKAGIYFDFEKVVNTNICELERIKTNPVTRLTIQSCAGSTYTFNGNTISTSGTYRDTLKTYDGRDSTLILTIDFVNPTYSTLKESVCEGTSVMFQNQVLTVPGIYKDTLLNSGGCDSIVTLILIHFKPGASNTKASVCQGQSFNFNNKVYSAAGVYKDTLANYQGCDSVCVLELSIDSLNADIQKNGRILYTTVTNATYQWYRCDNGFILIQGANMDSLEADTIGYYRVLVTQGDCSDTSSCVYVDANDMNILSSYSAVNLLSIFPNPGNGHFNIESKLPGTLRIYEQSGKLLLETSVLDNTSINLENAAAGIYYFVYQTASGLLQGKIVIQSLN